MKKYMTALIFLLLLFSCGRTQVDRSSTSVLTIVPYRHAGTWVFDDVRAGLHRESFSMGTPEIFDKLVKDVPNAEKGFLLSFSATPFPGYSTKFVWIRGKHGGSNCYYSEELKAEGCLCPALYRYFKNEPKEIYVKAEPISRGR